MKRFTKRHKLATILLATGLVLGIGGAAFAWFTTTGSGTGSAQIGTASTVHITQIGPVYDSTIAFSAYQYSQAFNGPEITQLGNEVTLSSSPGPLNNVVVAMAMCDGGCEGINASVIPSYTTPITVNIYDPTNLTTPIATATQTVTVPPVPVNTAAVPFNATFDFSSQNVTLPTTVVYGITLDQLVTDCTTTPADCGNDPNPVGSLNVGLSTEPTDVSVGLDANPGYIDVSSLQADVSGTALARNLGNCPGAPAGVLTNFQSVPVACAAGYSLQPAGGLPSLIPAVQINVENAGVGDLYPGGPSLPVNFSVTNPGSAGVHVTTVTIAVASYEGDIEQVAGDSATVVPGCVASWFTPNGSPVTLNQNIPPGGTINWIGAASISMTNVSGSQDACQGFTVGLSFSSP